MLGYSQDIINKKITIRCRTCQYNCHVEFLIDPSKKELECISYHFSFPDPIDQSDQPNPVWFLTSFRRYYPSGQAKTNLSCATKRGDYRNMVVLPYFISINDNDEMGQQVWRIFHRLKNLAVFS
jgi:hypothetical protein